LREDIFTPHGEEAQRAVSNHEAGSVASSFETLAFGELLRMRR
jgi:hypothetical protein